jgi:hypothetical protein
MKIIKTLILFFILSSWAFSGNGVQKPINSTSAFNVLAVDSIAIIAQALKRNLSGNDTLRNRIGKLESQIDVLIRTQHAKSWKEWIIAAIPGLAALVALFGLWVNWRIFKKSQKPIIDLTIVLVDNEPMGFYLNNVGNGPAKIEEYCVFVDKKEINTAAGNPADLLGDALGFAHANAISASKYPKGTWIPQGGKVPLFIVDLALLRKEGIELEAEEIHKMCMRLEYRIGWSSVCGDKDHHAFDSQQFK